VLVLTPRSTQTTLPQLCSQSRQKRKQLCCAHPYANTPSIARVTQQLLTLAAAAIGRSFCQTAQHAYQGWPSATNMACLIGTVLPPWQHCLLPALSSMLLEKAQ
jgi:hypothetical protein